MIEAVTAILVYEDEVFVIKRQPHLRAFPGYHAFPGGKIDAGDSRIERPHALTDDHSQPHLAALNRELYEELNFDLGMALEQGGIDSIALFGKAITPAFERVRFCAWYYKIVLNSRPDFVLEQNEIAQGGWYKPAEINARYLQGEILMVVPMCNTLKRLAEDIHASTCMPFNIDSPDDELPCLELIHGLRTLPIPSNTLLPATNTNALLLGDDGRRQVLVDPSPESDEVYQRLLNTFRERPLDALLISHHHPDHHEYAIDFAREKGLPVLMTKATVYWLNTHFGEDYLDGIAIEEIAEGSVISYWKGSPIRVYELPGHDEGMVGLAPDCLRWFFIADLAQTQGSILIPERGGDLALYMHSLQRVIDLKPETILPSHGIPAGGTVLLERTLQHRIEREQQISELHLQAMSEDEMVRALYPTLDNKYRDFAQQTVRQHIRKIKQEQYA